MKYLSVIAISVCCLIYTSVANADVIEIIKVNTNEIYPVEYHLYAEQPTGYVEVKNISDLEKIHIDATVEMTNYTAETIVGSETLHPGESAKVPLLMAFKTNILSLKKPISELPSQITIAVYAGENKIDQKMISHRYRVYSRNRIPQEVEKLAMFVNPKDRIISDYIANNVILAEAGNRLERAEKLFAALQSSEIKCLSAPVGEDVEHPRELLRTKLGTSYDCSLLYAALLESNEIPAALAFVPQQYMLVLFEMPDGKVTRNNRKWIPIDMRELKQTFSGAQEAGANAYGNWQETGELKFIDLRQTWQKYQPVQFETANDIIAAKNIESGIKHAQRGELDEAFAIFDKIFVTNKNNSVALNNLGNLHLLKGDANKAIDTYQKAISNDEDDAGILLNIGLTYYTQGNDEASIAYFTQAREHLDNYTQMCTLLGIKPDDEQHEDLKERLLKADAVVRRDNEIISRPLGTRRVVLLAASLPVYWKWE